MWKPTELNVMGHHLYEKINNRLSHVHSSAIICSLLISYSLQCSSSERSLVPHSHTSALAFLGLWQNSPSSPTRQAGLHRSFLESTLFRTFPVETQHCSKTSFEGSGGSRGHTSTPQSNAVRRGKAAKSPVFLYTALELPPQRQGELTSWSTVTWWCQDPPKPCIPS